MLEKRQVLREPVAREAVQRAITVEAEPVLV